MSLFPESLKQILAEVEKFFTESLKNEKLGKKALEHKALIVEKLESFFQDNPAMKLNQSQETVSAGLPPVAVTDLKDPVYAGFLEKKENKGSGLFRTTKFKTRWCVIHEGNFYYFAEQDEQKQRGSFSLEGYRFRNAPGLSPKKKELCFELFHPDDKKRVYQFMAKNKEEYEQWQTFVESREEEIYDWVNDGNIEATPKLISSTVEENPEPPHEATEEPIYEVANAVSEPPLAPELPPFHPQLSKISPQPTPTKQSPSIPRASKLTRPVPPPVSRSPAVQQKSLKATEAAVGDADEQLYYDAISTGNSDENSLTQPQPPVPGTNLLSTPSVSSSILKRPLRDLPPTPVPKKRINISLTCKPAADFENNFYGKWDCTADNDNELSFRRGDIIHILSREFDENSWWIGELNGNFGLVPKNYLVPAYTLVTY